MSELADDDLLAGIRTYWEGTDPVPDGMMARLQTTAALAASELYDVGLDIELMLLYVVPGVAGEKNRVVTSLTAKQVFAGR